MTPPKTRPPRDKAPVSGADGTVPPPPPVPADVVAAEFAARTAADTSSPRPGPPPKPVIPAAVAAARFVDAPTGDDEADSASEPVVQSEPAGEAETEAIGEPGPVVEAEAEAEANGEPEPVVEAEAEAEAIGEPEPVLGAEPMPAAEPDAELERVIVRDAEPETLLEPESIVEPEPEPEPEPMVEAESESESEPMVETESDPVAEDEPTPVMDPEPEMAVEPEPDPTVEAQPEPEPEPVVESEPVAVEAEGRELDPDEQDPFAELLSDDETRDEDEQLDAVTPATAVLALDDPERTPAGPVPALRMSNVSKSFGRTRAVDAVHLEIPAGTFYGIVGPNGAGKTTTLSMIAGLLRPDAGTIEVGGVDLRRDPRAGKALMGVLPDRLRTFDRLTGRQLLHYYGVLRGLRPAVVAERTEDLGRAFDLIAALARPVSDYSAGMTKKIMLAGAMIHAPRLLVLDEPFEAVDPVSSEVILDILSAYVARGGTVVLSSHGMELVERVCDGVAVIVAGQVLAQGSVDDVKGDHTLAERFVQLTGGLSDVEGLEWLHTYSD